MRVFSELLNELLPQIANHLKKFSFDSMFFSLNWFICLYTDKLDEKVSIAILDMVIIKGSEILHNIGLALLMLISDEILKC